MDRLEKLLEEYGKGKECLVKGCNGDLELAQELLDVATFIHNDINNADEGYDKIQEICEDNELDFKDIISTITAMLIIRQMSDALLPEILGE